jgi:ribosomal protein S18 acetylase RimI-like enzyme
MSASACADLEGFSAVSRSREMLSWRALAQSDMQAVADLAGQCLSFDGGQPYAADPGFLACWYGPDARTCAGWDGPLLICVSSLRLPAGAAGDRKGADAVTTGLVHPARRHRGIGGHAFDWAAGQAGNRALRAETEMLNDGAHVLYLREGLSQVFSEDVMQLAGNAQLPASRGPEGLILSHWGQADPARYYAVYQASFRDRPGFPGWAQERWIEWISGDEDFRPDWTLLATIDGGDVGFIVGDAAGWIGQMGVIPAARGMDVGVRLLAEAVRRMRSAGETTITLNVNVDNPHATALYRRLGFTRTGRRARYEVRA